MKDAYESLAGKYADLCKIVGGGPALQVTPQHDGSVHIELNPTGYSYVVTERGSEFTRRTTAVEDELLYWLLSDITFGAGVEYELKHRVSGMDYRHIIFSKQLELLSKISSSWSKRREEEIAKTLLAHPYRDEQLAQPTVQADGPASGGSAA